MADAVRESADPKKPRVLQPSEWVRLLIGLVGFPIFLVGGVFAYGFTGHQDVLESSAHQLLPYEAGAAGLYAFVFFRWWTVLYAGSFEYLYDAVKYAGSEVHVYYTYNRLHLALTMAAAAAVGLIVRLGWNAGRERMSAE